MLLFSFAFFVWFYCNVRFPSQEFPPAGGVTFSPPKKSPKSRQKPMVSGLPFCPSAPVVRGGPASWRRCFPCDDLTLPPRSAAALWDVVSGWSLDPFPPLRFLLNLFLLSQGSVYIRFYYPKVRGRHFCEKKCRAAGQAAHCSVSAAYENSVYSIRTTHQVI